MQGAHQTAALNSDRCREDTKLIWWIRVGAGKTPNCWMCVFSSALRLYDNWPQLRWKRHPNRGVYLWWVKLLHPENNMFAKSRREHTTTWESNQPDHEKRWAIFNNFQRWTNSIVINTSFFSACKFSLNSLYQSIFSIHFKLKFIPNSEVWQAAT